MFLRNCWYVAMWGEALTGNTPQGRQILGEPVVFFRKQDGSVAALLDSCPHRFAAFSVRGKVLEGDRLQCPYHGLVFDAEGRCVHNPHPPGNLPPAAKVKTYPCREVDGLVWVWMGDPALADAGSIPRYPALSESPPEMVSKRDYIEFDASYLLIIENLLDLSHANVLHEGILGNAESFDAEVTVEFDRKGLTVTRWNRDIPVPGLYDLMYRREGGRVDMWTTMTWRAPGGLVNDTGVTALGAAQAAGTGIFGHHFLTPIDETRTLYHFCAVRQNPPPLDAETAAFVGNQISILRRAAFEDQDKAVISAQQQRLLNPTVDTSRPVLLRVDEAPMRFRRILDALIAEEQAVAEPA